MTHIKLYWNHICVLHKQELIFLDKIKKLLLQEEIDRSANLINRPCPYQPPK